MISARVRRLGGGLARAAAAALLGAALVGGVVGGTSASGRSTRGAVSAPVSAAAASTPAGHAVPAGAQATSVSFVSSQTAFVLGQSPCGKTQCTVILRTENRGRSWVALAAPAEPVGLEFVKRGLWGVRFADARRGFAYGYGLWQTSDGGASWQRAAVPGGGSVLAFAAVADRELVAATIDCAPNQICNKATSLYHRSLTGGSWQRFASPSGTAVAVHGDVVWLSFGTGLLVSSDSGRSFRTVSVPSQCRTPGGGLSSISDDGPHTYLLCITNAATGRSSKVVFRETGTAAAWTTVGYPPRFGTATELAAGNDSNIVLATWSAFSALLRSGNAGKNWKNVLEYADGGAGFGDLGFASARDGDVIHGPRQAALGVAAAPGSPFGQLLLTDDGGLTWKATKF